MYDFRSVEEKWQRRWSEWGLYKTPQKPRKKFYLLEMFAYPSGDIHMGHFRNYGVGDVVWRFLRMKGYDILHPFGWDSFGLPAEQAALKHGMSPSRWTDQNIATGKRTLQKLGISYDWEREIKTSSPEYYRWTQWVFLKLYEAGLVYRDLAAVNWCPSCKTVLANEQVVGGRCWRCDSPIEKRELEQWFVRITAYAQRLLDDLEKLEGKWPSQIITMQRNWIGRSDGVELDFVLEGGTKIPVFTTRPDTIFGVTFVTVAPDAKITKRLLDLIPESRRAQVESYIKESLMRTEAERSALEHEKDGVFTGLFAENPISGDKVPVWVADYVLASYGTGAVMGVPGHDQRDFEFAKKYDLPIKVVINPPGESLDPSSMTEAYTAPGVMVNSGDFDGLPSEEGIDRVIAHSEKLGVGRRRTTYHLRDWLISRQRYWGAPIPMIHCPRCGVVPVPEEDLPVLLPPEEKVDFIPKGRSPLADVPEFVNTTCPRCGGNAKRDPDTMDTFVCSSWYYLRYTSPHDETKPFAPEEVKKWLPVDLYIGGAEHATGHLIYFRFVHKVLYDLGYIPKDVGDEPALRLFNHGMVLDEHGEVMSKSKGNVVSPMEVVEEVGVDAARVAMLFFAPPDKEILWSKSGIRGATRFLARVEKTFSHKPKTRQSPNPATLSEADLKLLKALHRTIKRVSEDTQKLQFNTAIAALMEFLNVLPRDFGGDHPLYFTVADNFTRLLAPFAPHIAEELNERLGFEGSVFTREYPTHDDALAREEEVEIGVQVNGKARGSIVVPADATQEDALARAKQNPKIAKWLEGKEIAKVVYVKGRILNIVVK